MAYSHVLISRPGPEAVELAEMVEGIGLVPLLMPAFRFEPAYPGLDFNATWAPGKRRLIIFSSTRAVEFGLRQLPAGFLDGTEIAAIGPATGNALEAAGCSVSILPHGEFNSEALLLHPALNEHPGKAIIFAAPGGRQKLFSGLQALGWKAEFAHVYQAVPLAPDEKDIESIIHCHRLLSVWTSANALRQLSASLEPGAWSKVCEGDWIVNSPRLAKIAKAHTWGQVHVTDGPGNEAIKDCMLQLI